MTFLAVTCRLVAVSNAQYCWNKIISKGIGTQTMKEKNSPSAVVSETNSPEANHSAIEEGVQRHWQGVVKRRSFLKGLGIAGATLSAGAVLGSEGNAQATRSPGKLFKGDAALLRFAAAAELIEADLWQQYNELGGVQGGNPA